MERILRVQMYVGMGMGMRVVVTLVDVCANHFLLWLVEIVFYQFIAK